MTADEGHGGAPLDDDAADSDDRAALRELTALVDQLDADNERLRLRVLDVMRLMEDAVTAQVAGERRIADLERSLAAARAELAAIESTRTMRLTQPVRSAYRRIRSATGRGGGHGDG